MDIEIKNFIEIKNLIGKLKQVHGLTRGEYRTLLSYYQEEEVRAHLAQEAREVREEYYGRKVFIRGLIEFTNICKNNCYYCGIRRSNSQVERFRLTKDQIMECCAQGYELGFRTFVLQGGEDGYYTDEVLCDILQEIRRTYADCAITLSVGERTKESYQKLRQAGADRYLLRHETATKEHYQSLHPPDMSFSHRRQCLADLKHLGYQVGCGFMVGSPGQTEEHLVEDLIYIQEFQPDMVGIGPFIPHQATCFAKEPAGTVELTTYLLSIIRLMLPAVLLPATTALGTIDPQGREKGLQAGANVLMPNLSPQSSRKKYQLYDNKICTGEEAAESIKLLEERLRTVGYEITVDRGDKKQI